MTSAKPQRPPRTLVAIDDAITDADMLQICKEQSAALVPRVSKIRMREAGAKLAKDKPAGKEPGGGGAKRMGGAKLAKRRKRRTGRALRRKVGVAVATVAAGEQCAANAAGEMAVGSAGDGQVAPTFPPAEWPPINFRIDTAQAGWKNALHTRQQMQINSDMLFV